LWFINVLLIWLVWILRICKQVTTQTGWLCVSVLAKRSDAFLVFGLAVEHSNFLAVRYLWSPFFSVLHLHFCIVMCPVYLCVHMHKLSHPANSVLYLSLSIYLIHLWRYLAINSPLLCCGSVQYYIGFHSSFQVGKAGLNLSLLF